MIRQGDVLLVPVTQLPKNLTAVPADAGRLVLARGEATGHHHSVDATCATLNLGEGGGVMYLDVKELTDVQHQEHAAIPLAPGMYEVRIQREYSPGAIRNVMD